MGVLLSLPSGILNDRIEAKYFILISLIAGSCFFFPFDKNIVILCAYCAFCSFGFYKKPVSDKL